MANAQWNLLCKRLFDILYPWLMVRLEFSIVAPQAFTHSLTPVPSPRHFRLHSYFVSFALT